VSLARPRGDDLSLLAGIHVSHQFSGFHGIVIPGTLHDSPYVLDGLFEQ
jgi:TnpA family transposase